MAKRPIPSPIQDEARNRTQDIKQFDRVNSIEQKKEKRA
ncbi:unnamed protein product, partial [marine sediment metagenome]